MSLDAAGPPEYLVGHLEDAFARDPRLCEQGLHVSVPAPGVVRVTGAVTAPERQQAVRELVHELLPGAELRDETVVADYPEDGRADDVAGDAPA
jgi:hypothetical protein